jgi:valyl-tRNA synthetase
MELIKPIIVAVRNIRAQYNIPYSKEVEVIFNVRKLKDREIIQKGERYIKKLSKASSLKELKGEKPLRSAAAAVGGVEIFVPLMGLIDIDKERARLERELEKTAAELAKVSAKLANKAFIEHAKEELIEEEKRVQENLAGAKRTIEESIKSLHG